VSRLPHVFFCSRTAPKNFVVFVRCKRLGHQQSPSGDWLAERVFRDLGTLRLARVFVLLFFFSFVELSTGSEIRICMSFPPLV